MAPPRFMSIQETASYFTCSEATIRRLIRARRLPALLIRGAWRIDRGEAVQAFQAQAAADIDKLRPGRRGGR